VKRLLVLVAACGGSTPAPAPAPPAEPQPGIRLLASAPPDALVLRVQAARWFCNIDHGHEIRTDDLRVPAGRAIKLVVSTRERPQDAPGMEVALLGTDERRPITSDRPAELVFRVDIPGSYQWKCPTIVRSNSGETVMDRAVKPLTVLPAAEYDAFIAENRADDPKNAVRIGADLYIRKGCKACHTIDGSPRVGPSWKGIWGTTVVDDAGKTRVVDEAYVRESILDPWTFVVADHPRSMPSFEGQLRDYQLAALVAYIQSLR